MLRAPQKRTLPNISLVFQNVLALRWCEGQLRLTAAICQLWLSMQSWSPVCCWLWSSLEALWVINVPVNDTCPSRQRIREQSELKKAPKTCIERDNDHNKADTMVTSAGA
eukprot:260476-Amphidinium_carterae.1